jgi:hypothetical protein
MRNLLFIQKDTLKLSTVKLFFLISPESRAEKQNPQLT